MGSPRILVLDDDRLILQMIHDTLAADGFEIVTAQTSKQAFGQAISSEFDLVISDVNVPDSSGFSFRDDLRKLPAYEKKPFLFFTAADPKIELQLAASLGGDRLLLKPSTPAQLRREVYVALKRTRTERADLPDGLADMISRVASDRETGVFTAVAGTSVKRVIFQDGKIAFAASNDPREVIGQVFVRAGLISEKDLAEAFVYRDANPIAGKKQPLGVVLTALRKVTPEQCEKVFQKKIKETVLDLFLWKTGVIEFVGGGLEEADKPFPIALDARVLLIEGMKRRTRWFEVQKLLPDPSVKFDRKGGAWPKGFPANDGDRVLAKHIEAKRSMAEILVELRGQDFAVGVRLADLVKNGTIVPAASTGFSGATFHDSVTIDIDEVLSSMEEEDSRPSDSVEVDTVPSATTGTRVLEKPELQTAVTLQPVSPVTGPATIESVDPIPLENIEEISDLTIEPLQAIEEMPPVVVGSTKSAPDAPTIALLTRALVLFRGGDLAGARDGLAAVLSIDPMNPLARQRLAEVEAMLASQAQSTGLGMTTKVKLAIQIHELVGRAIPPNDAFLLSRLAAGALSLAELVQICPMPEGEIRKSLSTYLQSGVLKTID